MALIHNQCSLGLSFVVRTTKHLTLQRLGWYWAEGLCHNPKPGRPDASASIKLAWESKWFFSRVPRQVNLKWYHVSKHTFCFYKAIDNPDFKPKCNTLLGAAVSISVTSRVGSRRTGTPVEGKEEIHCAGGPLANKLTHQFLLLSSFSLLPSPLASLLSQLWAHTLLLTGKLGRISDLLLKHFWNHMKWISKSETLWKPRLSAGGTSTWIVSGLPPNQPLQNTSPPWTNLFIC